MFNLSKKLALALFGILLVSGFSGCGKKEEKDPLKKVPKELDKAADKTNKDIDDVKEKTQKVLKDMGDKAK